MNIFLAGVHGVGKTWLASQLPAQYGFTHVSSSTLIREAKAGPNWGPDKKVANIDENQVELISAVQRRNASGERLLLDGHFVLYDQAGKLVSLDTSVFRDLNLSGVILVEAPVETIAERIKGRDGREVDLAQQTRFLEAEREHGIAVSSILHIPLQILTSATIQDFEAAIFKVK